MIDSPIQVSNCATLFWYMLWTDVCHVSSDNCSVTWSFCGC